jgi:hypothetical protein
MLIGRGRVNGKRESFQHGDTNGEAASPHLGDGQDYLCRYIFHTTPRPLFRQLKTPGEIVRDRSYAENNLATRLVQEGSFFAGVDATKAKTFRARFQPGAELPAPAARGALHPVVMGRGGVLGWLRRFVGRAHFRKVPS